MHTVSPRQTSSSSSMCKSVSSLSFGIQASTSTTNSTASDISSNSNDFNPESMSSSYSTGFSKDIHQHHQYRLKTSSSTTMDHPSRHAHRRRRKRTIFSAADIEHLKEAFAQNPKPTRNDHRKISKRISCFSFRTRYCCPLGTIRS